MDEFSPRPARVVVVDDDPVVARALASVLKSQGHTVETFLSGQEALERVRNEPPVEVVISDVSMPKLTGSSRKIQSSSRSP